MLTSELRIDLPSQLPLPQSEERLREREERCPQLFYLTVGDGGMEPIVQ
jgi:hypothetical protein